MTHLKADWLREWMDHREANDLSNEYFALWVIENIDASSVDIVLFTLMERPHILEEFVATAGRFEIGDEWIYGEGGLEIVTEERYEAIQTLIQRAKQQAHSAS